MTKGLKAAAILIALLLCNPLTISIVAVNYYFSKKKIAFVHEEIARRIADAKDAVATQRWRLARESLDEAGKIITSEKLNTPECRIMSEEISELQHAANSGESLQEAEARRIQSKLEADELFEKANRAIKGQDFKSAKLYLSQYLQTYQARDRLYADGMLRFINAAESNSGAIVFLTQMSDKAFSKFLNSGELNESNSKIPEALRQRLLKLLHSNLPAALENRERLKRLRDQADRLAKEEELMKRNKEKLQRYERDTRNIREAVLEDTIYPETAFFVNQFEIIINTRKNRVYVGGYRSKGLSGLMGWDYIFAEVDSSGKVLKLHIEDKNYINDDLGIK